MEQKDYILREIEKIGRIISAIREKLFLRKDNVAIITVKEINDLNGMLLKQIDFDLEKFLQLDYEELNEYLNSFEGFNIENIEELADLISLLGFTNKSIKFLSKSLQLYELINLKSKTFSFERERKIQKINNFLS